MRVNIRKTDDKTNNNINNLQISESTVYLVKGAKTPMSLEGIDNETDCRNVGKLDDMFSTLENRMPILTKYEPVIKPNHYLIRYSWNDDHFQFRLKDFMNLSFVDDITTSNQGIIFKILKSTSMFNNTNYHHHYQNNSDDNNTNNNTRRHKNKKRKLNEIMPTKTTESKEIPPYRQKNGQSTATIDNMGINSQPMTNQDDNVKMSGNTNNQQPPLQNNVSPALSFSYRKYRERSKSRPPPPLSQTSLAHQEVPFSPSSLSYQQHNDNNNKLLNMLDTRSFQYFPSQQQQQQIYQPAVSSLRTTIYNDNNNNNQHNDSDDDYMKNIKCHPQTLENNNNNGRKHNNVDNGNTNNQQERRGRSITPKRKR